MDTKICKRSGKKVNKQSNCSNCLCKKKVTRIEKLVNKITNYIFDRPVLMAAIILSALTALFI